MMIDYEVKALRLGIYRLHWKSGGTSVASVGMIENGDKWMAPTNWVRPSENQLNWRDVEKAVFLFGQSASNPDKE